MNADGVINIGIDQKILTVEFESPNKTQNIHEAKKLYNQAAKEGTNIVAAQDGNKVYLMQKSNNISNQAKKETKKLTPQQKKDKEKAAEKQQEMADVDPAVRQKSYDNLVKSIESRAADTRKKLENGNTKYSPEEIDKIIEAQKKREMNGSAVSALGESLGL